MEKQEAKQLCEKHKYRYVRVWTDQGMVHDGFIEHVDDDKMYLAIPLGHEQMQVHANAPYHHENMQHHGNAPYYHENMQHHGNAPYYHEHMQHHAKTPCHHEHMQHHAKKPCHHEHMQHGYVHGSVGAPTQAQGNNNMYPNTNLPMHPNANMNYPYYETRAFYPGYYPPFGYGYGYGYPGRFRRMVLPLAALTAISLLPFF